MEMEQIKFYKGPTLSTGRQAFADSPQGEALGIFKGLALGLTLGAFFLLPLSASAGVIRKPPNNLGLVAYWPMNEGNGTVVTDHSGNSRTGTFTGSVTYPPVWANGKFSKALDFSGTAPSNGRIRITALNVTTTHTVSMWIRLSANCSGYAALFTEVDNTGLYCMPNGGNKINYYGATSGDISNTPISLNQWHHIAVVNNAGSGTFYLDGNANGTIVSAIAYSASAIGNDNSGEHFPGYIDDLRVYNRALSASEVAYIYKSGSVKIGLSNSSPGTLTDGLTGHWTFDGKDMVSNVADVSGNGRNGFLTNFTSTTTAVGKVGQALTFNNTNKYVQTTGYIWSNFITSSEGTVSAWVRPRGTSPNCTTVGMYNCDLAVSGNMTLAALGIARGNNTTLGQDKLWVVNMTGPGTHQVVGADYIVDEWAHITWVHSGGALSIYKDGVFIDSTSSGNTSDLASALWIGRGWIGSANSWNGDIDEVRTYNRALTAAEIKQVYNIGAGQKVSKTSTPTGSLQTGLVGHWTFDGGDTNWNTNTVTDKSGNGNTGTFTNMSTTTSPVSGKIGQALNFTAANFQSVNLGTSATIQPTTNFSVSFWYKGLKGTTESFVSSGPTCCNYWDIENGSAVFSLFSTAVVSKTYSLPNDNEWHHLVVVFDRTPSPDTLEVYIDGVSQGTATGTFNGQSISGIGGVNIGRGSWLTGAPRQGPMDDVRIYNRVLTASEVKQLYNLGR